MARKWLGSADIEINTATGAILVDGSGVPLPSSLAGGSKTLAAAAAAQPLVGQPTPCQAVWIGPRVDGDGVALNTKPCFIGDSQSQNIPILPDNAEGLILRIDDAAKLFVKAGVNGEGVVYRIFA